jgi:hypothetical protein
VPDEFVNVRSMVDDVENAVDFYTSPSASRCALATRRRSPTSCAAICGCYSVARRAWPGGRCPSGRTPERGNQIGLFQPAGT